MSYEEDAMCRKCDRKSNCEYPCEQYTDYILNKALINMDDTENKKENNSMDDTNIDIEDILTYSIESAEFLQAVNGLINPKNVISENLLLMVLTNINEEYCKENNLCEICRCEFEDYDDHSEHFGTPVSERISGCPRCGG